MVGKPTYEELEQRVKELERGVAEGRGVETTLEADGRKFFSILEEVPAFICLQAQDYSIRYANRYFIQHFGETEGKLCYEVLWGRTEPCETCPTFRVFDTDSPQVRERYCDFKQRTYEVYDYPFTDVDGTPLVLELGVDITERKRAEKEGQQSEQRYRLLVETMNDGLGVQDKNGLLTYVNDRACEMLGYSRDEIIGRAVTDFLDDTNQRILKKEMARRRIGKPGFYELVWTGKKGQKICTVMSAEPLYDDKGHFEGSFAVLTDITQRKQVEATLRESENRYRILLENLSQKIFHKDSKSVYVSCNENYARDLKIRPEEIKGKTDYEFFPKELAKKYRADDRKITKSGKAVEIEETYIRDGQEMWVNTVKTPIKDEEGNVTGVLGIFWDITHRKRHQDALRAREAALEVRTSELEEVNSALRVLLKRMNEDKRELEEKVLLNVKELVAPYAEKLKKSGLDAKQMAYLSIVEQNLNDITAPFVDKLSSRYLALTPAEIQTAQLVKDGKTIKEIAELLNVSPLTIESRRKDIRRKMGIKNRKVNLRSYLLSI